MNGGHEWKARPAAQRDEHTGNKQCQYLEKRQCGETRDIRRPAGNGQVGRESKHHRDDRYKDRHRSDDKRANQKPDKLEIAQHRNRAQSMNYK